MSKVEIKVKDGYSLIDPKWILLIDGLEYRYVDHNNLTNELVLTEEVSGKFILVNTESLDELKNKPKTSNTVSEIIKLWQNQPLYKDDFDKVFSALEEAVKRGIINNEAFILDDGKLIKK